MAPDEGKTISSTLVVKSSYGERLRSLVGLMVMIALAWGCSVDRRRVRWSLVATGVGLQIGLGLLTQTALGAWIFSRFNRFAVSILDYTNEGTQLLFGDLARPGHSAYLAFGALPTIILFSTLMAILYHLGIMNRVVELFSWLVQKALGTSGAETLSTVGNVFVGQTEAPLLIRPYLPHMTRSELMAVMTGGFATIAGGVMMIYVSLLKDTFADVAGHLLSASIMSAPAALVVAKIMVPERDTPQTLGQIRLTKGGCYHKDSNVVDAAARGVSEGLSLTLNVVAMLLAFTALVAMANGFLGEVVGWFIPGQSLTIEQIFGWLGAPLAWIMGVRWEDATAVGGLLGVKTVLTEFIAYQQLAELTGELHPRSIVIASYALCGFANFGSVGIQLGGISPLAPERRADLASLVMRAMVGGTLAAFMTACVIGVLI